MVAQISKWRSKWKRSNTLIIFKCKKKLIDSHLKSSTRILYFYHLYMTKSVYYCLVPRRRVRTIRYAIENFSVTILSHYL